MNNGQVKVVTGIRRCGKSYLLFTLFADYLKKNGVDDEHIIEVALDEALNEHLRDPHELALYLRDRIKLQLKPLNGASLSSTSSRKSWGAAH